MSAANREPADAVPAWLVPTFAAFGAAVGIAALASLLLIILPSLGAGAGRRGTLLLAVAAGGVSLIGAATLALPLAVRPLIARARLRMQAVRERRLLGLMRAMLLPRATTSAAGEICAGAVAGDGTARGYYDVIVEPRGCWLAAGDIGGASLESGLILLMVQGALNALAQYRSALPPAALLRVLAEVVDENVRHRLGTVASVRLGLCHVFADGRVVYAGVPGTAQICRAVDGALEALPPDGAARLGPGDLVLLCSESLLGAANAHGEALGPERLGAALAEERARPLAEIRAALEARAAAWAAPLAATGSLLLLRHQPTAAEGEPAGDTGELGAAGSAPSAVKPS